MNEPIKRGYIYIGRDGKYHLSRMHEEVPVFSDYHRDKVGQWAEINGWELPFEKEE